jgi:hypothetical protein
MFPNLAAINLPHLRITKHLKDPEASGNLLKINILWKWPGEKKSSETGACRHKAPGLKTVATFGHIRSKRSSNSSMAWVRLNALVFVKLQLGR